MSALEPDDLPPELRHLTVPDDARDLDADRLAYYRELAARHRHDQLARLSAHRPGWSGRRPAWIGTGTLALGGLILLSLVAAIVLVLSPRTGTPATPQRLASPAVEPGSVGGLLPQATVTVSDRERNLRDARPVVLLMVPPAGCDAACEQSVAALGRQAAPLRLPVALVGAPEDEAVLTEVSARTLSGGPVVLDPAEAMSETFAPSGTTAVLVHADGVVGAVVRDLTPTTRLESALAPLAQPGATGDDPFGSGGR